MNEEKIYPISLSPSYCKDWDINHALREILQNQLDAGGGDVYYDPDTKELRIINYNNQIPKQYLLLGNGSKVTSDNQAGGFSEGGKIAWLILTRHGHKVEIRNGNTLWVPYYDHSDLFGCDMLHVSETPLEDNVDVEYIISDINQETYDEMCRRCLFLVDDLEIIETTKYGNILDKGEQAQLFVAGLYVCDTDMEYTYDIKPQHLTLNRDRSCPDNYDLKSMVRNMWNEVEDKGKAVDLLFNNSSDAFYFNSQYTPMSSEMVDACYAKSVKEYGENVVLADSHSDKETLVKQGYKNVVVTGNSSFNEIVRRSSHYQDTIEVEEKMEYSATEVLELYINTHRHNMSEESYTHINNVLELFIDKGVEWGYSEIVTEDDLDFLLGVEV